MVDNITNNKNFNDSLIINETLKDSLLSDNNKNVLFIGIIFVLTILLIISIIILFLLFRKRKKVNSGSNKNMILNKIILKNPNNNISLNIVNPKDFQKLQNTSNISDAGIIQPNNVLNEIKTQNLKEEIHKIINTSSSSDSSRAKRGKRKRITNPNNNSGNKIEKNNIDNNNKEVSLDNSNIINNAKKESISDVNTQNLEEEIKQQIKKYVVEEHNI